MSDEIRNTETRREGDKVIVRKRVRKKRSGKNKNKLTKKQLIINIVKIAFFAAIIISLLIVFFNVFSGIIQ